MVDAGGKPESRVYKLRLKTKNIQGKGCDRWSDRDQ